MNNLLLTLAVGVIFIVVVHSSLRFFTRVSSLKTALITLLALCSVYIPLLIVDWPTIDVFAIQFAIYGVTLYLLSILHSQAILHSKQRTDGTKTSRKLHWGPLAIISFFVVVVIVDSIFITIAQKGNDSLLSGLFIPEPKSGGEVSSFFPGIIEHNYHEKHDQYNQYQQRLDAQRQRGWQVKYGWQEKPYANQAAVFMLSLHDVNSKPITQAAISGSFQRGNTSKQDQAITLKETENGLYKTDVTLKYPGRWELILKVHSSAGDYDIKASTEVME